MNRVIVATIFLVALLAVASAFACDQCGGVAPAISPVAAQVNSGYGMGTVQTFREVRTYTLPAAPAAVVPPPTCGGQANLNGLGGYSTASTFRSFRSFRSHGFNQAAAASYGFAAGLNAPVGYSGGSGASITINTSHQAGGQRRGILGRIFGGRRNRGQRITVKVR